LRGRGIVTSPTRIADEEVNTRYAELERLTYETLARQQPVARDLRFLVSATRILYELERSGDLVVNLAYAVQSDQRLPGFSATAQHDGAPRR
jgi:phosphate transport system protein